MPPSVFLQSHHWLTRLIDPGANRAVRGIAYHMRCTLSVLQLLATESEVARFSTSCYLGHALHFERRVLVRQV